MAVLEIRGDDRSGMRCEEACSVSPRGQADGMGGAVGDRGGGMVSILHIFS